MKIPCFALNNGLSSCPAHIEGTSRRDPSGSHSSPGFTLIELMIAMVVGLIVLGAVYNLFTVQNKQLGNQEIITEMQQNARIAMDMITRDVRLAGYNPAQTLTRCTGTTTTSSTTCVGIRSATAHSISFTTDIDEDGDLTPGSGNPNENIIYQRYWSTSGACYALGRTSNGTNSPVICNLDNLDFDYLDVNGNATTNLANIREIQVTLQTKASRTDPSYPLNNGFRTYTLISRVAPRNLAY